MWNKNTASAKESENWPYFAVSIIIQTSCKHQLLKITVRIPPGLPKILGRTRRALNALLVQILMDKKNYSRLCSIMCGKMCAWFNFSYGLKNVFLRFINILSHWHVSGSRSSLVNMEARPLTSDMLTRRCVVTRLSDLTIERFKEAVQTLGAGAILILLPKNTSIAALEQKEVNLPSIKYSTMLCKISVFYGLPIILSWILEGKIRPMKYGLTLRVTDCCFVIL